MSPVSTSLAEERVLREFHAFMELLRPTLWLALLQLLDYEESIRRKGSLSLIFSKYAFISLFTFCKLGKVVHYIRCSNASGNLALPSIVRLHFFPGKILSEVVSSINTSRFALSAHSLIPSLEAGSLCGDYIHSHQILKPSRKYGP
jgi:hypothetical protein